MEEINTTAQDIKANYLFNTVVLIATELVKMCTGLNRRQKMVDVIRIGELAKTIASKGGVERSASKRDCTTSVGKYYHISSGSDFGPHINAMFDVENNKVVRVSFEDCETEEDVQQAVKDLQDFAIDCLEGRA